VTYEPHDPDKPHDPRHPDPTPARLARLEEAHAFAEHAHDVLAAHVADLERRLTETTDRLRRLEAGAQRAADDDPP